MTIIVIVPPRRARWRTGYVVAAVQPHPCYWCGRWTRRPSYCADDCKACAHGQYRRLVRDYEYLSAHPDVLECFSDGPLPVVQRATDGTAPSAAE